MNDKIRPMTLDQAAHLAEEMAANPADALHQMRMLAKWLSEMPPPTSELMSPVAFKHASLWTNVAVFENVAPNQIVEGVEVRSQRTLWIRGCVAQAIPVFDDQNWGINDPEDFIERLLLFDRPMCSPNRRGLFDLNYRLDGSQGFISTGGAGETLAPAVSITGDGRYQASMDWKLETNQHISVSIQNTTGQRNSDNEDDAFSMAQTLRMVVVSFWGLELGGWDPIVGEFMPPDLAGKPF